MRHTVAQGSRLTVFGAEMASERLTHLVAQLAELRRHLLPDPFDETGVYEDEDKVAMTALAYRVLAHAEIEAYFEDRALEAANSARAAWDERSHVSRIALCLLAFSGKEMPSPPDTLEAPTENKRKAWPMLVDVSERFAPVVTSFHHYVRTENHGVREKNLLSLLLPLGIGPAQLDPTFLAAIDSFGSLRGQAAHTSSRRAVRQAINPAEEYRRVEGLMPGIEAIDSLLDDLIAGAAPV